MTQADLRRLRALVDELESADAFQRRDALEELVLLTQQRLGFEWGAPDKDRARAVRRWRRWLESESERRQGEEVNATLQLLAKGKVDPASLQKLLQTLPPDQKKALVAQIMLAKAAAEGPADVGRPACVRCERRPATVYVTSLRDDGTWAHEALCEVCAGAEAG